MTHESLNGSYDSSTRDQHFISQVEQRLNALNPSANTKKQRIYQFAIVDREQHKIQLTKPNGVSISNSLYESDPFSFDVVDRRTRANFESVFRGHEEKIRELTNTILQNGRIGSLNQEPFELFVAKMLNYIRNPFSIEKVINTFGGVGNHHPTDPVTFKDYERILNGIRPHQAYFCSKFSVTQSQYEHWLRILFMLLTPLLDGRSIFEETLADLFSDTQTALQIYVHQYTTERCLLSDRGWTLPIGQGPNIAFDFNLSAHAFIRYFFCDYNHLPNGPLPPMIQKALSHGPKQVPLFHVIDDLAALRVFNRRVVEQSFEHVYCSGITAYGLESPC